MRRIFTLITVFIVLVGIVSASSLSIYGAVEDPKEYQLTIEETIALINASDFTMVVSYNDGSTVNYSGGAYTAESIALDNLDGEYIVVRLPNTRQLAGKTITKIDITFPFSIDIKGCTSLWFPCSVGYYFNDNSDGSTMGPYSSIFQVDNSNAPLGNQVVFSGVFDGTSTTASSTFWTTRDGFRFTYRYYKSDIGNGLAYRYDNTNSVKYFTPSFDYSFRGPYVQPITFYSDVTSIGYIFNFGTVSTYQNYAGIALYFPSLYFIAQSYSIGGSDPDDPSEGGDYKEQLDQIYDELVKQGKIQQSQNQQIIQGQQDIIKGQQNIEDAINEGFSNLDDTLKNPTPEQSSQISENQSVFESQQSELQSKLDEVEVTLAPEDEQLMTSLLDDMGSIADQIDPSDSLSIWSIIYAFFDDVHAGGILISIAVLLWTFVLIKALLYGVHT